MKYIFKEHVKIVKINMAKFVKFLHRLKIIGCYKYKVNGLNNVIFNKIDTRLFTILKKCLLPNLNPAS